MEYKSIGEILKTERKPDTRVEYEYQEIGLEMQKWFPKSEWRLIWPLFYKYPVYSVKRAFKETRDRNKKTVRYLIVVLRNMK